MSVGYTGRLRSVPAPDGVLPWRLLSDRFEVAPPPIPAGLAWLGASAAVGAADASASLRDYLLAGFTSDDWTDALLGAPAKDVRVPPLKDTLALWRKRKVVDTDTFAKLTDELKGQAGRLVGVWDTRFVDEVYASLFDAIANGSTLSEWIPKAQSLLDQYGADGSVRIFSGDRWSAWYADLVFRNANAAATAGGRYAEMFSREWIRRSPYFQNDAIDDSRVRPSHFALDGLVFRKDDPGARQFLAPLGHACFPGDTQVSCAPRKGFRASYVGPVVTLDTVGGHRLTLTVNHPVLTARGWVAAQDVCEGDEIFAQRAGAEGRGDVGRLLEGASFVPRANADAVPAVGVDFDHRPAGALELFRSLGPACNRQPTRVRAEDFDGDARFFHGDVDAVAALGALRSHGEPGVAQGARELVLVLAAAAQAGTVRARRLLEFLATLLSPASGIPSGGALAFDGAAVGLQGGPFQPFGLASAAECYSGVRERGAEDHTGQARAVRKALQALPGFVSRPNLRGEQCRSALPGSATVRLAGLATRVRRVEKGDFAGDVFDFETPHGAIVANGIAISNCRCISLELSQADVDDGGYKVKRGRDVDAEPDEGWQADRVASLVPEALKNLGGR